MMQGGENFCKMVHLMRAGKLQQSGGNQELAQEMIQSINIINLYS